ESALTMALDACASRISDDSRMHCSRGQNHAVSRLQLEVLALAFEHERDRAFHAVKNLLVVVRVGGVTVAGPVRPRVAAAGFVPQLRHELVESWHQPILRLRW